MREISLDDLPSGWTIAKLEDLLVPLEDGRTLHHGWSPQCEAEPSPSDDVWGVLKTTAIQKGEFLSQHNKRLPSKLLPRPQHEVKEGDLIITCAGPRVRCGIPCLVRKTRPRLMLSGKMYRFRVSRTNFDAAYLEKYLLSHDAQVAIDGMKTGGSDSGLNLTHDRFKPLPVPVAPLKEQQRISSKIDEIFSEIEESERALEKVRTLVERYRQSVLKAAITGELTRDWREKHKDKLESGEALLARILKARREAWETAELAKMKAKGLKSTDPVFGKKYKKPVAIGTDYLALIPEGWQKVSMDALGEIQLGRQRSPQHHSGEHMRPYLRVANVFEESIDAGDVMSMNFTPDEFLIYALRSRDILLNEGQSKELVGRPAIYRDEIPGACFTNTLVRFRSSAAILPEFAILIFLHYMKAGYFQKIATITTNIAHLGAGRFAELSAPVPSIEEQREIVSITDQLLSNIRHLNEEVERQIASGKSLRQAVLRSAFTGKLTHQEVSDEPASILLERIAKERTGIAKNKKRTATLPPRAVRTKGKTKA